MGLLELMASFSYGRILQGARAVNSIHIGMVARVGDEVTGVVLNLSISPIAQRQTVVSTNAS